MGIEALNNGTMANYALFGLSSAVSRIQDSTIRLATNNRIVNAGDDVAALSVATKLRSQVSSLRQALMNTSQADSFLQVAYGGLSEISDILDRMSAIATQSNSGSLTNADRAFLDTEFQELISEIDSIAGSTNFNGIKLLDGSVSGESRVSQTTTNATRATAMLSFSAAAGAGQTVNINGVTFTEGVAFAGGGSAAATVNNLAAALNASTNTAISQATYTPLGNVLQITHDSGGALGNQFRINQNTSTAPFTTSGNSTVTANVFTLTGGTDDGMYLSGVLATGTVGDTLVNTQNQTPASVTLNLTSSTFTAGQQIRIDDGAAGTVNFTFSAAPVATTDILIGATQEDTLKNIVSTMSNYTGVDDFGVRQLDIRSNGSAIIFTSKTPGNPLDLTGANLAISETMGNATLSSASFNTGTSTGINTQGVTNSSFLGQISGFSATFNSPDNITASITVGSETYTSTITDTTPPANATARFNSANGGYFDVQLASAGGMAVANQANADTYAARLDSAFGTMNFYQSRIVSSFTASGQLAGARAEMQLEEFDSNQRIQDIQVTASPGAGFDAVTEITINDEVFRSEPNVGGTIRAFETTRFFSTVDPNRQLVIRNGSVQIDLTNQTNADTYEDSLKSAFGYGSTGAGLDFQIGQSSSDLMNVKINSAMSAALFDGAVMDVATQPAAAAAQPIIDEALNRITSIIADVGAYQQNLDFTSSYLSNAITNVDLARGILEDTDIAYESTQFAAATVQSQAAVSVLAQVNSLQSTLLDLLRNNL